MKIGTTIVAAAMLISGGVLAGPPEHAGPPVSSVTIECNWGTLTMESILDLDFDQGGHSSDPSGDGHGPGTADEPRAGLANVLERGNLQATCEFIESML
ncbi:hypothetical protein GCM10011348_06380 [Marinobacterium nitratireducens]|uniref:Uncharacterized protein n=1 Tax=Marinobacterium nitratireducens TaxID=518897 RepID=A0A917Z802_9GAMM|nr:hypothetical protein [Marinobacterium nitratireducens]GGO77263.1 hypothetical protein GCM10011348_06380 [Marinobacterium nitratireducens]